ncbi:MAG: patatin-like phospholipase family protein, partial [Acidimicrobiales bacterium]
MSDEKTAFVLAGGGTKGAFEVGAVTYLVGELALVPDIITAASAGSIIASVLAQARTPEELRQRAVEIGQDLLAMTDLRVVFGRQPWVEDLQGTPIGDAIDAMIELRPPEPELTDDPTLPPPPGPAPDPSGAHRAHHHRFSLHALRLAVRSLPALVHVRRDFPGHGSSILTLDPLADRLRGIGPSVAPTFAALDPALVARPGLELRLAITALRSGRTRYVTEAGVVVEADAVTPCAEHTEPVDLIEAVLTSASAPLIFPSRRLGDQDYADGGIGHNLPVAPAVSLGATHIYAVLAMALDQPPDLRDFSRATFLDLDLRTTMIMFADLQRANLEAPRPAGVDLTVIAPTVELVGTFEVNEGLMQIDMDYGRLRAQEATATVDEATRARAFALTDRVIVARDHAWFAEEALWQARTRSATGSPATAGMLEQVVALKGVVRTALAERVALGLPSPEGADAWATTWEAHTGPRPAGL